MNTTESITLSTALWGALTGTIALLIQLKQHHADRAHLKLDAVLSITSDRTSKTRVTFTIDAVNHGRRLIRIESAGIELPPTKPPLPEGVIEERNELFVFQSERAGRRVELEGEGGKFTFRTDPFPRELLSVLGRRATAFVEDTRGHRYRVKFDVIPEGQTPKDE
ncbi:MAG: hypothetical protein WCK55_01495 [Verrucomicrobiota bacterium]